MPAADPRDVFRTVPAFDQHAPLFCLLGFVQLAFVVLHRMRLPGLGVGGRGVLLGLRRRTQQQQGGETDYFFHGV